MKPGYVGNMSKREAKFMRDKANGKSNPKTRLNYSFGANKCHKCGSYYGGIYTECPECNGAS